MVTIFKGRFYFYVVHIKSVSHNPLFMWCPVLGLHLAMLLFSLVTAFSSYPIFYTYVPLKPKIDTIE